MIFFPYNSIKNGNYGNAKTNKRLGGEDVRGHH